MDTTILSALVGAGSALLVVIVDKYFVLANEKRRNKESIRSKKIEVWSETLAQVTRISSEIDVYGFSEYVQIKKEFQNFHVEENRSHCLLVSREKYIELMTHCQRNRIYIDEYSKVDDIFWDLFAHQLAMEIELSHLTVYEGGSIHFERLEEIALENLLRIEKEV